MSPVKFSVITPLVRIAYRGMKLGKAFEFYIPRSLQ